jgi:hypothetical protein
MLQLVSMDLSGNQLSGSLPDSWSGMSSLAYMNISSNRLSGTTAVIVEQPCSGVGLSPAVLHTCCILAQGYNAPKA